MTVMKPIRILHVVTYMGRGGLETMIMNYYRHIDRSKIQFDFLTHRSEKADYDDEIEALGGTIYRLPRLVPWSSTYKKALDTFFKAHPEYRIVHVHQDCLSAVILKAATQNGVPVRIAHSHSSSQDKDIKYPIKLFYKRFIPRYATELFACGKSAGDWMFCGASYQVIYNAIDAKRFSFSQSKRNQMRKSLNIEHDATVIGHVGRFEIVKNHHFLLMVFLQFKKRHPNSKLLLIGDGELRNQIYTESKTLKIEDDVIFTGIRNDVPALMQAMDAFVLPSLYEGLGMVAVEAQAAGLPCILSDSIPAEAAVTDSVRFFSLNQSPEQWADEILFLLSSHKRKNTYWEICTAGYDIEDNAQQLQQFYLSKWSTA